MTDALTLVPVDPHILMDDHPLLRTVSRPVTDFEQAGELILAMIGVLMRQGGRGLAAVQIGVPLRVLIVRTETKPHHNYRAFINPIMTRYLNTLSTEREGCLSVPTYKWGDVARPRKCDVTWLGVDRQEHSATLTGEEARIFQHELDHLDGVLMTDRMK
jgi:peptide deformylase